MKTEELAELFLVALYDLAENAPHPYFLFSVNEFAPSMGITDGEQLFQALRLLESRDLIFSASMDALGGISAGITADGELFIEKGGETGIIARYRQDPNAFRAEAQTGPMLDRQPGSDMPVQPPPVTAPTPRADQGLDSLLSRIVAGLWRDTSIQEDVRQDLLRDVETLKLQLAKKSWNRAVIGAMLDALSQVPSIAPDVRQLTPVIMR
jgi:hypothetical protein